MNAEEAKRIAEQADKIYAADKAEEETQRTDEEIQAEVDSMPEEGVRLALFMALVRNKADETEIRHKQEAIELMEEDIARLIGQRDELRANLTGAVNHRLAFEHELRAMQARPPRRVALDLIAAIAGLDDTSPRALICLSKAVGSL